MNFDFFTNPQFQMLTAPGPTGLKGGGGAFQTLRSTFMPNPMGMDMGGASKKEMWAYSPIEMGIDKWLFGKKWQPEEAYR